MLNVVAEHNPLNSHLIGTDDIATFHTSPDGNQTCMRTSLGDVNNPGLYHILFDHLSSFVSSVKES